MAVTASYVVRRLGKRVVFELDGNVLTISASALLGPHYRINYDLADLNPSAFELQVRDERKTALIGLITVLGVLPFTYLLAHLKFLGDYSILYFPLWLVVGCFFSFLHPFRKEIVAYRHRSGASAFAIPREGPHKADHRGFVATLEKAIKAVLANAPSPAP